MTRSIAGVIVSAPRHRNPMANCSPAGQTITEIFLICSTAWNWSLPAKIRSEIVEISLDSPGECR